MFWPLNAALLIWHESSRLRFVFPDNGGSLAQEWCWGAVYGDERHAYQDQLLVEPCRWPLILHASVYVFCTSLWLVSHSNLTLSTGFPDRTKTNEVQSSFVVPEGHLTLLHLNTLRVEKDLNFLFMPPTTRSLQRTSHEAILCFNGLTF